MAIGERIKQARSMRGMSLRDIAQRAELSAQAISKYERGHDLPSSGALVRLAKGLDVRVEFFLRPHRVDKIVPAYRKRSTLKAKHESEVLAKVRDWLERYLEVERVRSLDELKFSPPKGFPYPVGSWDDAEKAAVSLRRAWGLGLDSIENLTELLEDKGVKVGTIEADEEFDACTFDAHAEGRIPVIVTRYGLPGDRQRLSLAHELGHLLLAPEGKLDREKVAYRFAGAFLVPEPTARFELGDHRRILDLYELHLLKHKYGLSMQAWIYRARDLGIVSQPTAAALFKRFKVHGWHKQEPGDPCPPETPKRFDRLVMQALAEAAISEGRASELLGKPLRRFLSEVAKEHKGLPVGLRYG
jgi:Zn-dependent peptidase ImmA (M78 family)/DNA-binding XRE family transcriptional regulator